MRALLAIIPMALVVSSCQSAGEARTTGATATAVSGPVVSAIAGDITGRFAEQVPPASTTLEIKPDQTDFAIALTAALKGWGYRVVAVPTSSDLRVVKLNYGLDGIDGQLLAQLTTPYIAVSRAYTVSSAGAFPISALSVMQRN